MFAEASHVSSKMFDSAPHLAVAIQIPVLGVVLIIAAWFVLYRLFGHIFTDIEHPPEEHTITRAKASVGVERRARLIETPYLPDAFPGGRQVRTVYGTIQVFEWGPEQGEKVLLVHGLGTPCIALGDMAKVFVSMGYRVMIFDLFGRGYSDTPNDLSHDARLYTTQILLVLSSSTLPWMGSSAFHIVGFSLGGSITVAFAAHHAHMLRSATLVCPVGLIRMSHISRRSRFLYSSRLIPHWLRLKLLRHSLAPAKRSSPCAEMPCETGAGCIVYDDISIAADRPHVRIGDVVQWQLDENPGSISSYLSTIRSSLVYRRHDGLWRTLREELARRRSMNPPPGLPRGRICSILAESDVIIVKDEILEDVQDILGFQAIDMSFMKGGHEVVVSGGKEVASLTVKWWRRLRS